MTAVLAAAVRAVAYITAGTVLVLIAVAAMIWSALGSQGYWTIVWLGVTGVVTAGCGVTLDWLWKRHRGARR
jgi:hypothetical protein